MQNKSLLGTYSHILRTWAAERLATPLPTHRGQTLNLQHYSVFCSGHMEQSEIGIFLSKSWRPQLCDQTLCFSAAATKGWAWCNHNAELVECAAALRDLKLLVGSGGLDFTKGMESLDKHVEKISFRQCHVLRTTAAERLEVTLPTDCC